MELQKRNFEWGMVSVGGISTSYKFYGTQLDYDFIQAFFDKDQEKMQELIKKGANPNVNIEYTYNDKKTYGTILMYRLYEKPYFNPQVRVLERDMERLRKLTVEEKGRYYDNLFKQAREEYSRILKKQNEINKQVAQDIIKDVDLLLAIGGRLTRNGGRLDLRENALESINFKSVRDYIIRAKEIDDIVENQMGDMYENYDKFLAKTTELRNSGKTIEEIKELLNSETGDEPTISDYLDKRFMELQEQYGEVFTEEILVKAKQQFNGSKLTFAEQVQQVEKSITNKIESTHTNKRKEDTGKYERENKTYSQIKNTHEKIKQILSGSDSKLYIAGGSVPYFILDQDSKRTHDDIDTIADLSDMSDLRRLFKKTKYYKPEWDTLTYVEDGNDYGFEMIVEGVPVGIYPFKYDNTTGNITQYTFDPYTKHCKIKNIHVEDLSDYVTNYKTKNGENINCMSLEQIKLSKVGANRPKDIADNRKIDEIGIRENVYSRISPYQQIQDMEASELNEKTPQYEAVSNAISRLDYETTHKYNRPLSTEEKQRMMEANVSNSYHDVRKNLAQVRNNMQESQHTQSLNRSNN